MTATPARRPDRRDRTARYINVQMQRQILWLTIGSADDTAFTDAAMTSFFRRLDAELPGLKLRGAEVRGALRDDVLSKLQAGYLDGARDAVQDSWNATAEAVLTHVTVYCPDPAHPAVGAARARLPNALWGISLSGTLSLTYAPRNLYALWHESLHLLGAQDHYDPTNFRSTCQMPSCLMQYAPDEHTVGSHPFVCPATAAILRRACD
jgi:hypothetical protein